MKLLRSRFRLISLLLTCVFLLTALVCTVTALKQAGVPLPSVQQVLQPSSSPAADAAATPSPQSTDQTIPSEETGIPETVSPETDAPLKETDIPTDSEYNIYGL